MARTKLNYNQQSYPIKSTDANGWTVYNYGNFKQYAKRFTYTFNMSAGTAAFMLNSAALPVGVANVSSVRISLTVGATGSAHGIDVNIEGNTSSTTLSVTARNDSGASMNVSTYLDFFLTDV